MARLYHGIKTTSCQAERFVLALSRLIGDLRSRMLASKVERMMRFIRLNRHLNYEVHELDEAVAQARARVARSAQKCVVAQEERLNISIDYRIDTTNGHVDRIPGLPALVQSFLGFFLWFLLLF